MHQDTFDLLHAKYHYSLDSCVSCKRLAAGRAHRYWFFVIQPFMISFFLCLAIGWVFSGGE